MYKIRGLSAAVFILSAAMIHITVLDRAAVFGFRPDILFALVIFFGLFAGRGVALESGLAAGLMKDTFSSGPFGLNTLVSALAAFLVNRISPHFYRESRFAQAVLTLVFYLLSAGARYVLMLACGPYSSFRMDCLPPFHDFFLSRALPEAAYTALAALIIFPRLAEFFKAGDRVML